MSTTVFIVFGVLIIWWFKSVVTSEVFIVSERHKESFSTLNYLELSRKTLEEAVPTYAQTGASRAGAMGGLDNTVPQKDGVAIWKTAPGEATIKDTLKRYIVDEIANVQSHPIAGKFITISYGSTEVEVIPDNGDFPKSEKFYVKGSKGVEVSKGLDTQGLKIKTSLKGYIDNEIKLKYFALYDAAKQFLGSGEIEKTVNEAFASVKTEGETTNEAAKCALPVAKCDPADEYSNACPVSSAVEPTAADVLATTDYPKLPAITISNTPAGEPFTSFKAKFEKHSLSANYDDAGALLSTGACSFDCGYKVENACGKCEFKKTCGAPLPGDTCDNGCVYDSGACVKPVCGAAPACGACECVSVVESKTKTCFADTITKKIKFTFVADAYEKYSSEDPNGFVPSKTLNVVLAVAKLLPYETLKFNFMTHSCTTMKSGYATVTELLADNSACAPTVLVPV